MFLKQLPLSIVWQLARHMCYPHAMHIHSSSGMPSPWAFPAPSVLLETSSHQSLGHFRRNIICPPLRNLDNGLCETWPQSQPFLNGSVSSTQIRTLRTNVNKVHFLKTWFCFKYLYYTYLKCTICKF